MKYKFHYPALTILNYYMYVVEFVTILVHFLSEFDHQVKDGQAGDFWPRPDDFKTVCVKLNLEWTNLHPRVLASREDDFVGN